MSVESDRNRSSLGPGRDYAPLVRVTAANPSLTEEEAYGIQRHSTRAALAGGRTLAGYKIGLTSPESQAAFGTDHPTYGLVYADMVQTPGAMLRVDNFARPRLEPEVAFRFDGGLRGVDVSPRQVLSAASAIFPAIEIADSRYGTWDINFLDSICDNASAAGAVLGEHHAFEEPFDRRPRCSVAVNGRLVQSESVDAPSPGWDQPARSVAWLVRMLAQSGSGIEPGMLVLSGALTPAVDVVVGDRYQVAFDSETVFDLTATCAAEA